MHFILVIYDYDDVVGAVIDAGVTQTDYHRQEPFHYDSDKYSPTEELIAGDSNLVCDLSRSFRARSRVIPGRVLIDFNHSIFEVEASGNWTRFDLQEIIVNAIHSYRSNVTIQIVTL
jgi:hypothetical protein